MSKFTASLDHFVSSSIPRMLYDKSVPVQYKETLIKFVSDLADVQKTSADENKSQITIQLSSQPKTDDDDSITLSKSEFEELSKRAKERDKFEQSASSAERLKDLSTGYASTYQDAFKQDLEYLVGEILPMVLTHPTASDEDKLNFAAFLKLVSNPHSRKLDGKIYNK